jgi:hypothetical protein
LCQRIINVVHCEIFEMPRFAPFQFRYLVEPIPFFVEFRQVAPYDPGLRKYGGMVT